MDLQLSCESNCFRLPVIGHPIFPPAGCATPSSVQDETYTYSSIKPWQIRLLELYPARKTAALQGRLLTATIIAQFGTQHAIVNDEIIQYRALSYTWGTLQRGFSMQLDGHTFNITANLDAALRALRDESTSILLWVDAICINQSDLSERSEQVANMLLIFKTAESVDVWLGESSQSTNIALTYLEQLTDQNMPHLVKDHSKTCWEDAQALLPHLGDLYSRSWLRRSWVRQEIFAAKAITVRCGSTSVSWSVFLKGIFSFHKACTLVGRLAGRDIVEQASRAMRLATDMYESTREGGQLVKDSRDLIDVLTVSQFFEATDERDKVYAVLGMCGVPISNASSATHQGAVKVDYTKSMSEIWREVTLHLISALRPGMPNTQDRVLTSPFTMPTNSQHSPRNSGFRDVLNLSGSTVVHASSDHPSWVTDWTQIRDPEQIAIIRSAKPQGTLFPYFKPSHSLSVQMPTPGETNTLNIRCWVWDVIDTIYAHTIGSLDTFIAMDGLPERWDQRQFDPQKHARRTASLLLASSYTKSTGAMELVPAAAQKGDVVVVIAPDVFPLIIRPVNPNNSSAATKKSSYAKRMTSGLGRSAIEVMDAVQTMRMAPMPIKPARDAYQMQVRSALTEKLRQHQDFILVGAVIGYWDKGCRIPSSTAEKMALDVRLC